MRKSKGIKDKDKVRDNQLTDKDNNLSNSQSQNQYKLRKNKLADLVNDSQNINNNSIILPNRDSNYLHLKNAGTDRIKQMRKLFQTFDLVYYLFQPHEAFMKK